MSVNKILKDLFKNKNHILANGKRRRSSYAVRRLMRPFRRSGLRGKMNYQYRQNEQRMGPGYTTRNFEEVIGVQRNTLQIYDLTSFCLKDEVDAMFRSYKYARLAGVLVTQNNLNMPEEQNCVYCNVDWTSNMETIEDIEYDDATKILPNIGTKTYVFRPPRSQLPTLFDNQTYEYIRLSDFQACQTFYQTGQDNFRLPGRIGFYNTTDSPRIIRVIIRVQFRGSRVIDKEQEAKRLLTKKGYKIIKEEKNENESVVSEGGEPKKNSDSYEVKNSLGHLKDEENELSAEMCKSEEIIEQYEENSDNDNMSC